MSDSKLPLSLWLTRCLIRALCGQGGPPEGEGKGGVGGTEEVQRQEGALGKRRSVGEAAAFMGTPSRRRLQASKKMSRWADTQASCHGSDGWLCFGSSRCQGAEGEMAGSWQTRRGQWDGGDHGTPVVAQEPGEHRPATSPPTGPQACAFAALSEALPGPLAVAGADPRWLGPPCYKDRPSHLRDLWHLGTRCESQLCLLCAVWLWACSRPLRAVAARL